MNTAEQTTPQHNHTQGPNNKQTQQKCSQSITYLITIYQSIWRLAYTTDTKTDRQRKKGTHTPKQQQNIQGTRNIHQHQ